MEKPSDFWLCASGAQSAITLVWSLRLSWSGFPNHREAWWVWDARGSNRAGSLLYLVVHTVLYSQCIFNVCVYTQRHFIHLAGCTCAAFLQCARSDKAGSGVCVVPFPGAATRPWVGCHQSTLDRTVLGSSWESYRAYCGFFWQIVITRQQSFCFWLPEHDRAIFYQLPVISWIIHGFKNW